MIRLIPRRDAAPVDPDALDGLNELIQARIDGQISRRALVARAAKLGMAAPVILTALHATSDYAHGAPSNGRAATLAALRQEGQPVRVAGPTQPAGTMVEGGTLVMATNEEPDTLHPWVSALVTTVPPHRRHRRVAAQVRQQPAAHPLARRELRDLCRTR